MIWARALHRLVKASDLPALSALSPLALPHSGARAGEGSTEEEGGREEGGLIDVAGKVGIVTGVDEADVGRMFLVQLGVRPGRVGRGRVIPEFFVARHDVGGVEGGGGVRGSGGLGVGAIKKLSVLLLFAVA